MHHISIRTPDLDRAERFYAHLGFLPEARYKNGKQQEASWIAGPCGRIELVQVQSAYVSCDSQKDAAFLGYDHFALNVQALDDVIARLLRGGASLLFEPMPRLLNGQNYRMAIVRDPDGLLLELIETVDALES